MPIGSFPVLQDFGAVVMSDLILETRPCHQLRRSRGRGIFNLKSMAPNPFLPASSEFKTNGAFLGKMTCS